MSQKRGEKLAKTDGIEWCWCWCWWWPYSITLTSILATIVYLHQWKSSLIPINSVAPSHIYLLPPGFAPPHCHTNQLHFYANLRDQIILSRETKKNRTLVNREEKVDFVFFLIWFEKKETTIAQFIQWPARLATCKAAFVQCKQNLALLTVFFSLSHNSSTVYQFSFSNFSIRRIQSNSIFWKIWKLKKGGKNWGSRWGCNRCTRSVCVCVCVKVTLVYHQRFAVSVSSSSEGGAEVCVCVSVRGLFRTQYTTCGEQLLARRKPKLYRNVANCITSHGACPAHFATVHFSQLTLASIGKCEKSI